MPGCGEKIEDAFGPLLPGSEQFRLQHNLAMKTSEVLLADWAFLQQSGMLVIGQEPSPSWAPAPTAPARMDTTSTKTVNHLRIIVPTILTASWSVKLTNRLTFRHPKPILAHLRESFIGVVRLKPPWHFSERHRVSLAIVLKVPGKERKDSMQTVKQVTNDFRVRDRFGLNRSCSRFPKGHNGGSGLVTSKSSSQTEVFIQICERHHRCRDLPPYQAAKGESQLDNPRGDEVSLVFRFGPPGPGQKAGHQSQCWKHKVHRLVQALSRSESSIRLRSVFGFHQARS